MMHAFVGCGRYQGNMLAAQLFTHTEDNGYVYRINPQSAILGADADRLFELFGWLLARALVDSVLLVRANYCYLVLLKHTSYISFRHQRRSCVATFSTIALQDVHFQPAFYKDLLSELDTTEGCELADLEACDKKLFDSLMQLLAMPEDEVEFVCYTFAIPDESSLEEGATRDLKPNGHSIEVTANNREEFVQLWSQWIMAGRVKNQRASSEPKHLLHLECSETHGSRVLTTRVCSWC